MTNEEQILRRVVDALLTVGDVIHLFYEGDFVTALTVTAETPFDLVVEAAFACDTCMLRVGSKWVHLIWGNGNDGWDAIADCGVSLEETLKPVMAWIEEQQPS